MSTGKVSPAPPDPEKQNPQQYNQQAPSSYSLPYSTALPPIPPPQPSQTAPDVPVKVFYPRKHLCEAYVLWFPFGILGAHHFYLRRYEFGFLYFFTAGLCGVGWIGDLLRMRQLVDEANERIEHPEIEQPLDVWDAYAMWFPLGFFGLHHFYMTRVNWGIMYSWTMGLFGIGWLIDVFRIPSLVRQANIDRPAQRLWEAQPRNAELSTAYILGLTPAGLFGSHHFYLGQWRYGLFYLYTVGGAGVGWIVDWFRMRWLVNRVNDPTKYPLGNRQKHLDSAYICAFPFGIFGAHHFYLGNYKLGTIYFFTLGCLGIGWLIDLVLMRCLVQKANKRLIKEQELADHIRRGLGIGPTVTVPGTSARQQNNTFINQAFDGQPQAPISLAESSELQPPSYTEAVSQSYPRPQYDFNVYPPLAPMGAEGGQVTATSAVGKSPLDW